MDLSINQTNTAGTGKNGLAKYQTGGIRMKRSFVSTALRNVGLALATFGFVAAIFLAFTSKAQALSISVGTPTVVSGVTIDAWTYLPASDNRIHVYYSTSNSTIFTIMLASNNVSGGYSFTPLSTGAVANKPYYMVVASSGTNETAHLFWYDSSSTTINYLIGNTALQSPQFLLGGNKVTMTGMHANDFNSGVLLTYSSKTAINTYNLVAASVTFGATSDTAGSFVNVVSTNQGNVSGGNFASFTDSVGARHGIVYFDNTDSALKIVYVNGGSVQEGTREVLDSGSISNIFVSEDSSSNATRLVYTHSSVGVKFAIRRRNVSNCWYVQKIDDGSAATLTNNMTVSYIKSGNLWTAFGQSGIFFDDFSEYIINRQRGLANLTTGATKGGITDNSFSGGGRPRGVFQTANGLATINFNTVQGDVYDSHPAPKDFIYSAAVRVNVKNGGSGAAAKDDNPACLTGESIGVTYHAYLASGATNVEISVSSGTVGSSPWTFILEDSTSVVVSTATTGSFSSSAFFATFVGISSPTFTSTGSAVSQTGVSAGANDPFILGSSATSVTWGSKVNSESTFTFTSRNIIMSDRFSNAGSFRFVPQTAKGTAPSFSASTGTSTEFGTSGHIAVRTFTQSGDRGKTVGGAMSQFKGIFSSTGSDLPKWYTIVYTTMVAGQAMQGYKTDALVLQ
ncbi:MAG: hypothetical protein HY610_03300, partial [Elusimicrobia bacterium]|nr:hypothetical protein [Elusimicrobiota bacterium]